jgi:hypothetical protein
VGAKPVQSDSGSPEEQFNRRQFARHGGIWIAPVVVIHLAVINGLIRIYTGHSLTAWPPIDRLLPWAWINGGMLTVAAFAMQRGPWSVGVHTLRGWRARIAVAAWVVGSIVWFCLPQIVAALRGSGAAGW